MGKLSDWKIILVEDTYDDQQVLSRLMAYHGGEVRVVYNGLACLELLEVFEPTVIVTDLTMPQCDGWQMLSELRAREGTAHIPVIAMSAYHSVDVAEDALDAGFDAYFPKPIHPEIFVKRLREIVES